jgi:hypothetical protein
METCRDRAQRDLRRFASYTRQRERQPEGKRRRRQTVNHVQIDDHTPLPVAHLAADDSVVTDIARGLYNLERAQHCAVDGCAIADHLPGDATDVDLPRVSLDREIAAVEAILAGRSDAEVWEADADVRIARYGGRRCTAEEYAAADPSVPCDLVPPYHAAPARRHRADAARRAFVLAVAGQIAERDASCLAHGHHWMRSGVLRGAPEA